MKSAQLKGKKEEKDLDPTCNPFQNVLKSYTKNYKDWTASLAKCLKSIMTKTK